MEEVTLELLERVLTWVHPSWTEEKVKEHAAKNIHVWLKDKDSEEQESTQN